MAWGLWLSYSIEEKEELRESIYERTSRGRSIVCLDRPHYRWFILLKQDKKPKSTVTNGYIMG